MNFNQSKNRRGILMVVGLVFLVCLIFNLIYHIDIWERDINAVQVINLENSYLPLTLVAPQCTRPWPMYRQTERTYQRLLRFHHSYRWLK